LSLRRSMLSPTVLSRPGRSFFLHWPEFAAIGAQADRSGSQLQQG
jgi:hypothetical protein